MITESGWQYVVVDIRWFVENTKAHGYNQTDPRYVMDEYGRFLPAVNRFPSAAGGKGFKPLADYVHSKGLKFGIHVMRGIPVEAVRKNTPILGSSGRATDVYSTEQQCPWLRDMHTIVVDRPGAQEYYDSIFRLYASWNVDYVKIDDLSRPYHHAEIEQITLMTLWSIFRSPLMFGGDLPSNDEFTLSLLTNEEVLAVNQNSTNNRQLYRRDGLIAWTADVPGATDKYVALFNTRDAAEAASVKVIFETVGLQGRCTVRDLWDRKDLGTFSDEFISPIPSHGAGLYRISPE